MITPTSPEEVTPSDIDSLWIAFTERMADIELAQRATKDIAKTELRELFQMSEQAKKFREGESPVSFHNMAFRDPRTGHRVVYFQKDLDLDARKFSVLIRKNRQYQWLLAEAWEEFEDYIHRLYAYCGKENADFWPLSDFGSITFSELKGKSFSWYVEQSKKKKGAPHSILVRFRETFPGLHAVEIKNSFDINLGVAISLIEKLRHLIVHNAGKAFNKRRFIETVAKQAGVVNNGKVAETVEQFVNQFFGVDEHENLVALLEIRTHPELPFESYVCRFGLLTNCLMAYGLLLSEYAKSIDSSLPGLPAA